MKKVVCIICGKAFVPVSSLQKACRGECIKIKNERRKRNWQYRNRPHRKEYMRKYQLEHREELSKKSVARVREWRKKNKRKYLAQAHESRFDGKWLKTMDRCNWQCVTCANEAQLVHHRDQNTMNNIDTNLVALCRACHCKIHKPHEGKQ
uniref:Putative HNH endonuclease n=1 Tax=viral metagenome TaxID=1070528 RepID=A0A6M3K5W1_9ZZZZ